MKSHAQCDLEKQVSGDVLRCIRDLRSDCVSNQQEAIRELRHLDWDTFFALPDLISSLLVPSIRDYAALRISNIVRKESCSESASGGRAIWPRSARYGRKKLAHKTYQRCILELDRVLCSGDVHARRHAADVAARFLELRSIWYPNQFHDPLVFALCRVGLHGPEECVPDVVSSLEGASDTRRTLVSFMVDSAECVNNFETATKRI